MNQEILSLAGAMGAPTGQEVLLTALCEAAQRALTAALRPGLSPADCGSAFPVACAMLTLDALEAGTGETGVASFTAGEVTIRRQGKGTPRQEQALRLMGPYLAARGFALQGVAG